MKYLIVYDTYFGNTQKVAEMIHESLREAGSELIKIDVLTQEKLDQAETVILGCPTRAFSMTSKMKKALKKYRFANKKFWAFDTRINIADVDNRFLCFMVKKFGYAAEKIQKILLRKKAVKLADYRYYYVRESEGPLFDRVREEIQEDLKALN